MLSLLGLAAAGGGIDTLGFLLGLLATGAIGIVVAFPTIKNSGILRYRFGSTSGGDEFNALDGGTQQIIQCMSGHVGGGDPTPQTPDRDGQLFGPTPGHPAILGTAGTLFAGSNPPARNVETTGPRPGQDKADVRVTGSSALANPSGAQTSLGASFAQMVGSAKVWAYFIVTGASVGLPLAAVETEVLTNPLRVAGVDQPGPQFIASIRVAVRNIAAPGVVLAGVLIVNVEHSIRDLPGLPRQDQVIIVPG